MKAQTLGDIRDALASVGGNLSAAGVTKRDVWLKVGNAKRGYFIVRGKNLTAALSHAMAEFSR